MNRPRVLIIDDEPSNLGLLRQILKEEYSLFFAKGGEEGLAAVERHEPALILLDVRMPDMDGYEVCRRLKADPAYAGIGPAPVDYIHGFDSAYVLMIECSALLARSRSDARRSFDLVCL